MKLALVGDIHAGFDIFISKIYSQIKQNRADIIFQLGDFGIYPTLFPEDLCGKLFDIPIYFIDGNHEEFRYLKKLCENGLKHNDGTYEIYPNIFYVPRGTVLKFGKEIIGCIGGANSIDKYYRKEGYDWFPEEEITDQDVENAIKKFKEENITMMFTHTPSYNIIFKHWGRLNLLEWHLPNNWLDISSIQISKLWPEVGSPPIYSGHMHRTVSDLNSHILDINEVRYLDV